MARRERISAVKVLGTNGSKISATVRGQQIANAIDHEKIARRRKFDREYNKIAVAAAWAKPRVIAITAAATYTAAQLAMAAEHGVQL